MTDIALNCMQINTYDHNGRYGYDILVDSNMKPWLLEVNASPSLSADTEADHELKYGMLDDVLTVVDFDHKYLLIEILMLLD